MEFTEAQVQSVVEQVLKNLTTRTSVPGAGPCSADGPAGVFREMDAAVEAAHEAFAEYRGYPVQMRGKIVQAIRRTGLQHKEMLSRMVFDETKMGKYEDKIIKHVYAAEMTPGTEDLQPQAWTGQNGLALEEQAPYGVIGAITPSTHPSETIINNAIMMLAAGNAVVFNPHPAARLVSAKVVSLLNEAMMEAGAPANLITTVETPSIESAEALFKHKSIALLSITGGPGVVRAAMKSNKKVIAAGPGNPPVLIDETADMGRAAEKITRSAAFDNNILCFAEKEVFVVDTVFNNFMQAMEEQGNARLSRSQMDNLAAAVFEKKKFLYMVKREYVGRDALVIAQVIGNQVNADTPLLFGETDRSHVFVKEEQMMPVLPVVRVKDFNEGLEACLEAEHGFRHSASIFTQNFNRATRFSRETDCAIVVINGGTYQGDGGEEGEAHLSFTIASPTGEAITRPRHFTRTRRIMTCGFNMI